MYKYKYKAKTSSEWLYEAEIGAENGTQLRNLFFFAVCWLGKILSYQTLHKTCTGVVSKPAGQVEKDGEVEGEAEEEGRRRGQGVQGGAQQRQAGGRVPGGAGGGENGSGK